MKDDVMLIAMKIFMWLMTMGGAFMLGRAQGYYDALRDRIKQ